MSERNDSASLREEIAAVLDSKFQDPSREPLQSLQRFRGELEALKEITEPLAPLATILKGRESGPAPSEKPTPWLPWLGAVAALITAGVLIFQTVAIRDQVDVQTRAYLLQSKVAYITQRTTIRDLIYSRCDSREASQSPCQNFDTKTLESALQAYLYFERLQDSEGQRGFGSKLIDLTRAPLSEFDFRGIDLQEVDLSGSSLNSSDFTLSLLGNTDLSATELKFSKFPSGRLEGIKFDGANLSNALLRKVSLSGSMAGAALYGTDLSSADLRSVSGLTPEQICEARVDEGSPPRLESNLLSELPADCFKRSLRSDSHEESPPTTRTDTPDED